jgi:hypothetical protein
MIDGAEQVKNLSLVLDAMPCKDLSADWFSACIHCRLELRADPIDEVCTCLRDQADCLKEYVRNLHVEVSPQVKKNVKGGIGMSAFYSHRGAQDDDEGITVA